MLDHAISSPTLRTMTSLENQGQENQEQNQGQTERSPNDSIFVFLGISWKTPVVPVSPDSSGPATLVKASLPITSIRKKHPRGSTNSASLRLRI